MTSIKMYNLNEFAYTPGKMDLYSSSQIYGDSIKFNDDITPIFDITSGEPNPNMEDSGDIDGMIKDRVRFQKLSAVQVIALILERELLRDKNVSSINSRHIYCQENLSRLHMCIKEPGDGAIGGLQRVLLDLEGQKRQESVSSWRDTLELKLSLLEKIQGYQNSKRQEALMQDAS
jgi:hypothetical protein